MKQMLWLGLHDDFDVIWNSQWGGIPSYLVGSE